MPFLVYFTVLLIAAGSVLFGMDWLSSPMSPMPAIKPVPVQSAKAPTVPVPAPIVTTVTAPPVNQTPPAPPVVARAEPAPAPAPVEVAPQVAAEEKPQPKCDIDACTAAYRSFTASDCTYQPNVGPRRLCTRGAAVEPADRATAAHAELNGRPAQCNVAACTDAYISFNAADCTYQPMNGPRRLCEK
jgi:hypothetical protein